MTIEIQREPAPVTHVKAKSQHTGRSLSAYRQVSTVLFTVRNARDYAEQVALDKDDAIAFAKAVLEMFGGKQ